MRSLARPMFELVEPIAVVPDAADEPNEAMFALGFTDWWDTEFPGRAAPLGTVPAEVVHARFDNFAPGELARHTMDAAPRSRCVRRSGSVVAGPSGGHGVPAAANRERAVFAQPVVIDAPSAAPAAPAEASSRSATERAAASTPLAVSGSA